MQDFKDKVAIITGGAGGVGRCIGLALAREGAKIVVADIEQGAIEKTVNDIKAIGGEAIGLHADVTKLESMKKAQADAVAAFGDYHLVFANVVLALASLACCGTMMTMTGTGVLMLMSGE